MHGPAVSRRAPDPKGPLDLGHQRNMGFVSPTHRTKLSLRMFPPATGGVWIRKRGFVPSGDTIWVATSPQRVPEPGPPCGGGGGTSAATV